MSSSTAISTFLLLAGSVSVIAACAKEYRGRDSWRTALLAVLAVAAFGLWISGVSSKTEQALSPSDRSAAATSWIALAFGGLAIIAASRSTALCRRKRTPANGDDSDPATDGSERAIQFGLFCFSIAGVVVASAAQDLLTVWAAAELAYRPWRIATASQRASGASSGFLQQELVTSACFAVAVMLLYVLAGSFDLNAIQSVLREAYRPVDSDQAVGRGSVLGTIALLFLFAGIGPRMLIVPFQVNSGISVGELSPWHVGWRLSVPVAASFLAIARVGLGTLAGFEEVGTLLAVVLGLSSMCVGNLLALRETNVRGLWWQLAVAQVGYVLVSLAVAFRDRYSGDDQAVTRADSTDVSSLPWGWLGILILSTLGWMAVMSYLRRPNRDIDYLEDLSGLARTNPGAGLSLAVCVLSVIGVPPFPGFWSRLGLFTAMLVTPAQHGDWLLWEIDAGYALLAVIVGVNLLLSAVVGGRILRYVLLEEPIARPQPSGGVSALGVALIVAACLGVWGVIPDRVLETVSTQEFPAGSDPKGPVGD